MVLVDDGDYKETLMILRGEQELPRIYFELKEWMKSKYAVTAHNFVYREIEYNNPERRFRLYALLSTTEDYRSMFAGGHYDAKKQAEIAGRFAELAEKYAFGDLEKARNVHVCYNDFSVEMKTDTNARAYRAALEKLYNKYSQNSVWKIIPAYTSTVVFYDTDEDVDANRSNGVSEEIKKDYYEELSRQDEFGLYTYEAFDMRYDSRENLDENYSGNLYYYFK